ncbi:TfpX/TfpZ family type IV pilin accessory protein [Thiocystis violacea]|uniref:TfpX/TfpZ family type IV pilin accessory protein n=1 Tax=Thiocystis violacea TaxID=13725 RepID=UPI0019049561|nr:TfpX/TfpZ family type IV pilin accessory protein [Thiocystis violacea]MBK1724901.1 hypothetical protein [Thiocystis violacea]
MTKTKAFAIHLSASISIMLVFLGVMWLAWYPAPYFAINGGWNVLRILAGVDVVLGPILTLIVFKPGKLSLKFDMSVIVGLQLAALAYGGSLIYQQRPAFAIFTIDRFTAVTAADVNFDQLGFPELKRFMGVGPILAEAAPPKDPKKLQEFLVDVVMNGGKDVEYRTELYQPYRPDVEQLTEHSLDIRGMASKNVKAKRALERFLTRTGGQPDDYLYLPLRGKNKDIVMVLSRQDGMPVGSIDIEPWLIKGG